ncbi:3'-5' exonuclease [Vibrio sp. TH_r3]|uniref:3'-5' exonuclease n=1 Tax=Vibrio sp. TH_r3 TaxID=3082084 RepID=UPI0029530276|nr:3'-5' exonuclease [Vibrio sp. TH_r3]MDV7103841.1 3'-5' exonuclease [Vibrio sp. TH_r3]
MQWINYFHPLRKLQRQRIISYKQRQLPEFLKLNLADEYPDLEDEANGLEFICLDLETTGLDPANDQILSIGWVVIRNLKIDISTRVELLVKSDAEVNAKTAVINHITPEMLSNGVTVDEALLAFFKQSRGRVIVAHGCVVEQNFIDHYFKHRYKLKPLPLLWLDTLMIEKHLSKIVDKSAATDLRLSTSRARYGLPEYNAHGALIDSLATAELLLAQLKKVYKDGKTCFGRLYRIGLYK